MALPVADTASQLPPEIQADRYLLQADEQFAKGDVAAAKRALDRILKLKEQQDLEIPGSCFFRNAQVLEGAELYDEAIQFVTRYLTLAGRDGSHYPAALRLLNSAEARRLWLMRQWKPQGRGQKRYGNEPSGEPQSRSSHCRDGVRPGPGGELPDGFEEQGGIL